MIKMTWAGAEKGWILETDKPINQSVFLKIWDYTLRDQKRQMATMKPGPEREVYENAYGYLKDMKITPVLKPQGGAI
jgi:hypothetical protein